MTAPAMHLERDNGPAVPRTIGLHGRTAVLWAMAGGVALGGVLVAAMTLTGRLSGHALFMNATALFIVGAILGLGHGVVLGYFGRPAGTLPRDALRDLALSAVYAVPGLALAWLAAIWVAMTLVAGYTGNTGAIVGVTIGWVGAATILGLAAVHGVRAIENAYRRWPERRVGTLLVAATFTALMVTFLADRPELWGVRLRMTEVGAVLLAAGISIWVAGPLITLALRLLRTIPTPREAAGLIEGRWTATDLAIGLTTGLVVGLMAVPFVTATVAPAAAGTIVIEVGQALLDEVLLRLGLVTGITWLLLRRHEIRPNEAAVGAVIVAAIAQVALYTPGALALGFPNWTNTVAFLATAAAVPAVAFGLLYWRRGFGTALVADATALIAITLLA